MGTSGIIHNLPLFFLKFTDQMENWGEDGIWELTVLATCGPNSQNLPRNSRIHWKKRKKCKIGLKIGFGNLGFIPLEGRILRIHPAYLEFVIFPFFSFLSKTSEPHKETLLVVVIDLTWQLRLYSTCMMNFQNLSRFLEFVEQMENQGHIGHCKSWY